MICWRLTREWLPVSETPLTINIDSFEKFKMAEGRDNFLSLKDVFEKGLILHKLIQNDDEPSSSKKVQVIF